jgi:hypothetical protein
MIIIRDNSTVIFAGKCFTIGLIYLYHKYFCIKDNSAYISTQIVHILFKDIDQYWTGIYRVSATISSKPCTKLTLHCNHRSGHLKTEHTESLFLLRRHLGNRPRGPAVSMRSELLVAREKLGQFPLLTVYVLPV